MSNYYVYVIYDGRFHTDPWDSVVMKTCHTLAEAQKHRTNYGDDCVIVRETVIDGIANENKSTVMPNSGKEPHEI